MYNELITIALGNGLWAALFCVLFLYQLKDSRARERKYMGTIDGLMISLKMLDEVNKTCNLALSEIKSVGEGLTTLRPPRRQAKKESADELSRQ